MTADPTARSTRLRPSGPHRPLRGYQAAPRRGILYMTAGSLLLTSNDAFLKWLTEMMPIAQIILLRGTVVCVALLALLWWRRGGLVTLKMGDWRGQAIRAALLVTATYLFVTALKHLPLATAIALVFASPLFTTALAVPLLGERVGWRRWSAVVVGFLGVLLLVKPFGGGLDWAALLGLGVAFCVASIDLVTRRLNLTDDSLSILFYSSLAVALSGLPVAPFDWQPVSLDAWWLLLASAVLMAVAQFLQIDAFRYATASTVAPYRYISLVWAAVLGFVLWGDLPDAWGALGVLLILGTGLYIWHREERRA